MLIGEEQSLEGLRQFLNFGVQVDVRVTQEESKKHILGRKQTRSFVHPPDRVRMPHSSPTCDLTSALAPQWAGHWGDSSRAAGDKAPQHNVPGRQEQWPTMRHSRHETGNGLLSREKPGREAPWKSPRVPVLKPPWEGNEFPSTGSWILRTKKREKSTAHFSGSVLRHQLGLCSKKLPSLKRIELEIQMGTNLSFGARHL